MNSISHPANQEPFKTDPPLSFLKDLTVRALEHHEYARAGELLDREHYLGNVPKGRQLLQVVERHRIYYYRKHDRPKELWLKTLNRNARRILTGMRQRGEIQNTGSRKTPRWELVIE